MQDNVETLRNTRHFGDKYSRFKAKNDIEIRFDI